MEIFVILGDEDNPKKCTARKLLKKGLAKETRHAKGIVLDPRAERILSPAVKAEAITVLDFSWRFYQDMPIFQNSYRLPFLIASNPQSYGKAYRLSSAEAVAAALWILGYKEKAINILSAFPWGDEFLKLNRKLLEFYTSTSLNPEEAEKKAMELYATGALAPEI